MNNSNSTLGQEIALRDTIIDRMQNLCVKPEDVLYVLGGAVIRTLDVMAKPLGYDRKEIIKVFAGGLASAQIEYNDQK